MTTTPAINPNDHVQTRLEENIIAWFTTVRPNGQPASVPIWFAWVDDELVVYSQDNQKKLTNLAANPRVSVTLDDTQRGEDVVRIEGTAEHRPDYPAAHQVPAFVAKYGRRMAPIGFADTEAFAATYSIPIVVTPTKLVAFQP